MTPAPPSAPVDDPLAAPPVPMVRFGTFAAALEGVDSFLEGVMLRRFRATPLASPGVVADARLRVHRPAGTAQDLPHGDELQMDHVGTRVRVRCGLVALDVDTAPHPIIADLTIQAGAWSEPTLEHYVAVFVHKLLQICGIVRLHGAAIEVGGRTHVFLGDKGAGKSTLALALGQAGGRVLADDQIVVRRRNGRMVVSGCDGHIRLTAESEHHFLKERLDAVPQDFAGTLKKEVRLDALVDAIPYQDRQAARLYFPRVARRFGVRPVARRDAVVRLLDAVAAAHRFAGPLDRWDLLRLVTDFVSDLECVDLELSPDLADLDRLVDLVQS